MEEEILGTLTWCLNTAILKHLVIVRGGFVDIFIELIHSQNDYQIQSIIYQIDDKDLLDYSMQTN